MTTFKLIKQKAFDTNGTKGTAYTCAYRGRVLNISSLSFADEAKDTIKVDDKAMTLVIDCNIEVLLRPYTDLATGATVNGLVVMPALGLGIAAA